MALVVMLGRVRVKTLFFFRGLLMILLSPANPGLRMINKNIYYFETPEKAIYTIEDVACVLGRKQRFNDHAPKVYSIAEHCVHAANLYSANRKGALMHDAPEFIMGDLITPIKQRVDGYKELEETVENDMARRFGYTPVDRTTFKVIDNVLYQVENSFLFDLPSVYDIEVPISCWGAEEAAEEFLKCFHSLA